MFIIKVKRILFTKAVFTTSLPMKDVKRNIIATRWADGPIPKFKLKKDKYVIIKSKEFMLKTQHTNKIITSLATNTNYNLIKII